VALEEFSMTRAIWNGHVLAESDAPAIVNGRVAFPISSVNWRYIRRTNKRTFSAQRGVARYFDADIEGRVIADAAWTAGGAGVPATECVVFWDGVNVTQSV
jgi:uncharacterized protein (DUF427 family)